jgi:hypothetical protein
VRLPVAITLVVLVLSAVVCAGAGSVSTGTRSPDGKWEVVFSRSHGFGRLDLTERVSGRRYRMYRSNDSCCDHITWVQPQTLVFVDDYRVLRLNPDKRSAQKIASFSDFVVSPNGRWVAGWADSGGHAPETVYVVPLGGGHCLRVPRRADQDDTSPEFFNSNTSIHILRRHFDLSLGEPKGRTQIVGFRIAALGPARAC